MHNTQQTQEKNNHAISRTRNRDSSNQAAKTYALDVAATGISEGVLLRVTTDEQFTSQ